jgi:hypothetical protein
MSELRRAWTDSIEPDDYERHMASVGQAQANAALLEEFFRDHAPHTGSRVHFAGAGTGQYFEYWTTASINGYDLVFTDINPRFLALLRTRTEHLAAQIRIDDVESPALDGPFELTVLVLVLEHVDWSRTVPAVCRRTNRAFVIIQEDPPQPIIRPLPGTLAILRTARPHLVDRAAVTEAFRREDFHLSRTSIRQVLDGKQMVGLDFRRQP